MSDVLNHRIRVRTGSRTSPPPSVVPHCFSPALFAAQAVERSAAPGLALCRFESDVSRTRLR
jgi:hypothetical protein